MILVVDWSLVKQIRSGGRTVGEDHARFFMLVQLQP